MTHDGVARLPAFRKDRGEVDSPARRLGKQYLTAPQPFRKTGTEKEGRKGLIGLASSPQNRSGAERGK